MDVNDYFSSDTSGEVWNCKLDNGVLYSEVLNEIGLVFFPDVVKLVI